MQSCPKELVVWRRMLNSDESQWGKDQVLWERAVRDLNLGWRFRKSLSKELSREKGVRWGEGHFRWEVPTPQSRKPEHSYTKKGGKDGGLSGAVRRTWWKEERCLFHQEGECGWRWVCQSGSRKLRELSNGYYFLCEIAGWVKQERTGRGGGGKGYYEQERRSCAHSQLNPSSFPSPHKANPP